VRLRELLGSKSIVHFQIDAAPARSLPRLVEARGGSSETSLLDALDDQRRMRRTALVGQFGVDSLVREDEDAQVAVRPRAPGSSIPRRPADRRRAGVGGA
jgi:hypothetical protein